MDVGFILAVVFGTIGGAIIGVVWIIFMFTFIIGKHIEGDTEEIV